jgi:hypothetical protein
MAHHELLTTQRNQVLAEIRDAGLNPAEFEWRDVVSDVTKTGLGSPPYTVQGIVHLPAGAGFVFDLDSRRGHHYAIFRPGRDGPSERINADTWFVALNYVREWLGLVKREYETPDLWAEIGQRRELLAGDLGVRPS